MEISEKVEIILSTLSKLFPKTECFLNYKKDYELLFAVILSAQATDKSVNSATSRLFSSFKTLDDYTYSRKDEIFNFIKSIGLGKSKCEYILKSAYKLRDEFNYLIPRNRDILTTFPGVGYKTSGVVLAELYDYPYIPVDTHVYRVSKRLGLISQSVSLIDCEKVLENIFLVDHRIQLHRRFILFGREICYSRNPHCEICPLKKICVYQKTGLVID